MQIDGKQLHFYLNNLTLRNETDNFTFISKFMLVSNETKVIAFDDTIAKNNLICSLIKKNNNLFKIKHKPPKITNITHSYNYIYIDLKNTVFGQIKEQLLKISVLEYLKLKYQVKDTKKFLQKIDWWANSQILHTKLENLSSLKLCELIVLSALLSTQQSKLFLFIDILGKIAPSLQSQLYRNFIQFLRPKNAALLFIESNPVNYSKDFLTHKIVSKNPYKKYETSKIFQNTQCLPLKDDIKLLLGKTAKKFNRYNIRFIYKPYITLLSSPPSYLQNNKINGIFFYSDKEKELLKKIVLHNCFNEKRCLSECINISLIDLGVEAPQLKLKEVIRIAAKNRNNCFKTDTDMTITILNMIGHFFPHYHLKPEFLAELPIKFIDQDIVHTAIFSYPFIEALIRNEPATIISKAPRYSHTLHKKMSKLLADALFCQGGQTIMVSNDANSLCKYCDKIIIVNNYNICGEITTSSNIPKINPALIHCLAKNSYQPL